MKTQKTLHLVALACAITLFANVPVTVQAKTLDITAEPPDVNTSAAPNLLLTFDDSGSMADHHMGDNPPFASKSWNNVWDCAGVLDPRVSAGNIKALPMNGVYYNPNVTYSPPRKDNQSSFPVADATLRKVWVDGIYVNKPTGGAAASTTASIFWDPDSVSNATDTRVADLFDTTSRDLCTGYDNNGNCNKKTTIKAWSCDWDDGNFALINPFDGTKASPDNATFKPIGGPYYYRLLSSVNVTVDSSTGLPDAAGQTAIYTAANWEAVPVPTAQYQNFANWFAYYRTRNLMARTSMTRAFDTVTDKLHVAWQNINSNKLSASDQIYPLVNNADSTATVDAKTWRTQFYTWLYQVPASGSTPNLTAVVRAGDFFSRGGVFNTTSQTYSSGNDAKNPYWEPIKNLAAGGQELSCRQNFHLVMTDGYWNGTNPAALAPTARDTLTLPDAKKYSATAAETAGFWYQDDSPATPDLADLAFYYWATDLRSGANSVDALANKVPAYIADTTIGVTNTTSRTVPADPSTDDEIYFNPNNDPATWQHVTQYTIGLGSPGNITPPTVSGQNDVLLKIRTKVKKWSAPNAGSDDGRKLDDLFHAAVNSRGRFFNAGNPDQLVKALSGIFKSIARRAGASTALSISSAIVSANTEAYGGGYNTNGWAGYVRKYPVLSTGATDFTPANIFWDAGCLLTGGSCPAVPASNGKVAPGSAGRKIFTSNGSTGIPLQWASLTTAQIAELNKDPDDGTLINDPTTWPSDTDGQLRLNYVRGDRSHEPVTSVPLFRARTSMLGAIINSQPTYVSSPGGLRDDFPIGSLENKAFDNGDSYEKFVSDNKARTPMVYVGANDGMLHAFDAQAGTETWAFVPNLIISNDQLTKSTASIAGLVPGVDSTPVVKDVLINGKWRTILVGSLRMGGRGVFALDITKPAAADETTAATKFMWEFTNKSTGGANLGYTFFGANIIRLNSPVAGKWGVVVSSGYFPSNWPDSTSTAATTDRTSLFVLDAETGARLAEIQTPVGTTSYGMSTPAAFDTDSNRTTDVLMAGDMAGNVWRFDASNADPTKWTVENFFRTYETGGALVGEQPVSSMPVAMYDDVAKVPVWIFGTGKYLGDEDRIASSAKTQYVYGVRDFGVASTNYPITPSKMSPQKLTDHIVDATTGFTVRAITQNAVASGKLGWDIPLDAEAGERVVVTITPLYVSNVALITTLIPNGNDPCDPKRKGVVMAVNAASGGFVDAINDSLIAVGGGWTPATGSGLAGVMVADPAFAGSTSAQVYKGGGGVQMAGLVDAKGNPIVLSNTYWHRGAWRELMDLH